MLVRKVTLLSLAVLILMGAVIRSRPPQAAAPAQPPLVASVTVRQAPVRATETVSGQAEAWRNAMVESEVPGRVLRRPHQGDRVAAGQVVVEVDPATAQAERDQAAAAATRAWAAYRQGQADYQRAVVETDAAVRQAQAQLEGAQAAHARIENGSRPQEVRTAEAALEQARADETLAEHDATRYRDLLDEGAIAPQTWDQAQDRLQTAQARRQQAEESLSMAREGARTEDRQSSVAQVASAQAGVQTASTRSLRLATLQDQLDALQAQAVEADAALREADLVVNKHHVRAPFAGRILATPAEAGELLAAGTPVVRIGDVHCIKATFSVAEQIRESLSLGRSVSIQCDALPHQTFQGRLTTLGFQADARTRTFPVEVAIDNPHQLLLPGMVLRLVITSAPTAQVVLPVTAVGTDGAVPYVFVLHGGRAEKRPVHLGVPAGTDVVVEDGVRPGETVASEPQRLTDGVAVRVLP